jgi:FkbM family methyltransferase
VERRHIKEVLRTPGCRLATRIDVVALYLCRRWWPRPKAIRLGAGHVYVDLSTLESDWGAWREIYLPRYGGYQTDYRDAVVVDIGAHKGYLAAFALLGGARTVLSYEPEGRNFELIDRAAASFDVEERWIRQQVAVGASARRDVLHLNAGSWAHSILQGADGEPRGTQRVDVVPMSGILDRAIALGGRLVVKVDAEGAECEIVLGTDTARWNQVDEVLLEHHGFAPCALEEIVAYLARAGLHFHERRSDVDRFVRLT